MISRAEFVKDIISFDNPGKELAKHYNEISVLYSICSGRSDVDIFTSKRKGKFGFAVSMKKDEAALKFRRCYDGYTYTVYGDTYRVRARMAKSDTVFMSISKNR